MRNKIGSRRTTLERQLANGAGELIRLGREGAARSQALLTQMKAAAQDVAQTRGRSCGALSVVRFSDLEAKMRATRRPRTEQHGV